jgi:hydroxymethylglutaryl-CoA lyase
MLMPTISDANLDSRPWPRQVHLREVGLRDGLQILTQVMATKHKCEWIDLAYEAGVREMEVGSFVPAHLMPQLADTAQLVAHGLTKPGMQVSVLVPNEKGAIRALECGAHALLVPLSASHAHSLANLRKTPDQVLDVIARIVELRNESGKTCRMEVGLSTAFGCTIQGEVSAQEVARLSAALVAIGVDRIGLADTVGYANPRQVEALFLQIKAIAGDLLDCGHFHDTRGLGVANVMAALRAGQTRFDACLGGLGGCPHAPGASGNVVLEDLVFLFESMGITSGIDLERLLELRKLISGWLDGVPLFGSIAKAGRPRAHSSSSQSLQASVL